MQSQSLITCHPQTDAQSVSEQRLSRKSSIFSVESYDVNYPFGQMWSVSIAVSLSVSCPLSLLTEGKMARHSKKQKPSVLCNSKQFSNRWNTGSSSTPFCHKHSTNQAAMKKINSIPDRPRNLKKNQTGLLDFFYFIIT